MPQLDVTNYLFEKRRERVLHQQNADRLDAIGAILEDFKTQWNAFTVTGDTTGNITAEYKNSDGDAFTAIK